VFKTQCIKRQTRLPHDEIIAIDLALHLRPRPNHFCQQRTNDLSWENSWRVNDGPANYDAVWVFGKYRVNGSEWRHMRANGFESGGDYEAINYVEGAIVYRRAEGAGDNAFKDLRYIFNYRSEGIDDNADFEVRLFAVEMVFVPTGAFTLGNGGPDANGSFFRDLSNNNNQEPPYPGYLISGEQAISVTTGGFSYLSGGDQLGPIPQEFPKGFNGFFCMKYEVSQQQWVDFFNTLNPTQQTNLDVTGPLGKNTDGLVNDNGVSWTPGSLATTTLPNLPMNYIPNAWVYAYLDWSGLRPMTELEFEKVCRGPVNPLPDEYVWGTVRVANQPYGVFGPGLSGARVTNPATNQGNAAYNGTVENLLRCGIFAASAVNADREETGGSYYGVMEMGGNLLERTISVGSPGTRAFDGSHGDGNLLPNGAANVAGWPDPSLGFSFRGGSFQSSSTFLRTGDRSFGNFSGEVDLFLNGIRGVLSL